MIDDPRPDLMDNLAEVFHKTLYDSRDGLEYASRFLAGVVVFVVSSEGVQVVDKSLGIPVDN